VHAFVLPYEAMGAKPSSLLLQTLQASSEARGRVHWTCSVGSLGMADFTLSQSSLSVCGSGVLSDYQSVQGTKEVGI